MLSERHVVMTVGHPPGTVSRATPLGDVRVLTDPFLGHVAAGAIRRRVPAMLPDTLVGISAVFLRRILGV